MPLALVVEMVAMVLGLVLVNRKGVSSPTARLRAKFKLQGTAGNQVGVRKPKLVQRLAIEFRRLDVKICRGIIVRRNDE